MKNTTQKIKTAILIILISTLSLAAAERGDVYVVSFKGELSETQIQTLTTNGSKILDTFERNSYLVRSNNVAALQSYNFVNSVKKRDAIDKIVAVGVPKTRVVSTASSSVELTLTMFSDSDFSEIRNLVSAQGGSLKSGRLFGNRVIVSVPTSAVAALANNSEVRTIENAPRQKVVHNAGVARASKVAQIRNTYGLTGRGVVGGIWDEGAVDAHPDLVGNFTVIDDAEVSNHATHVAGTIAGTGKGKNKATGMAPETHLYSYDFEGDIATEMFRAVKTNKILFSNNSWSYANGWSYHSALKLWLWWGDENFGRYTSESAAYDELVEKTNLIILFASGNDRGEKGTTSEKYLDMTINRGSDVKRGPDGPYMTIDVTSTAKNVISVGAVSKNGKMTSFSSWGPTRDGRVKPEIVDVGYKVTSTVTDGGYAKYSGTSMATPAASGGIALLIEQFNNVLGKNPSAAMMRALLAASSTDKGNEGPDYQYGFGMFNAANSAFIIEDSAEKGLIFEDTVSKSKRTSYYKINVPSGTKSLKVAIAWIDPAARPDAEKTLVNDLNLKMYRPDGSNEQLPWVLDGKNPEAPATKGINTVDNIELIEFANPDSGEWIIEVTADHLGKGNSQSFAMVVNSSDSIRSAVSEIASIK